ncbi:MAG: hypothetical protein R3E50_09455 [Halioglobus sp.]
MANRKELPITRLQDVECRKKLLKMLELIERMPLIRATQNVVIASVASVIRFIRINLVSVGIGRAIIGIVRDNVTVEMYDALLSNSLSNPHVPRVFADEFIN